MNADAADGRQPRFVEAAFARRADDGTEKADILLVDDLPDKLLVLRTVLEELGQNIVTAPSGAQALREVLQREFAVILLDVNMPDIDGFETAALIRQHKRSAHTPIIFITAYADELQTEKGYALGAVDYILSPVVPAVLCSKVKVFVDLFAMQRQIRRQADAHAGFVAAQAARRAAEVSDRRSAFLAEATRTLTRTLEVDAGMRDLLGLIVPGWASYAAVIGSDAAEPAATVLTATRSADGRAAHVLPQALGSLPRAVAGALEAALRDGRRCDLSPAQLDELAHAAPDADGPPRGIELAAALPLLNGDRRLGAVFVASRADDAKDPAIGWSLVDELVARSAAALENSLLYSSLQSEIVERRAAEVQLIEAGRRKDEFLAMLSHELRNPLAPIRTALELITRIGSPDAKFTWATDVMARQLRQMTRLIEELLDVARISQGKIALRREQVDLNAVIAEAVETVQPLIDARRQLLRVTPLAPTVRIHGDFARLSQILANLLSNASKYSPPGTVVELGAQVVQGEVRLAVRDQGIGIDAQLLPRVFDLFAQGQRSLDRSQGGLGIGLTLARRLAELHGGTIEARSDGPGLGSEFVLFLPATAAASGARRATQPVPRSTVPPARGLRILVVDDNHDAAESVARFLASENHEVRLAGDGVQALEVADSFAPQVVVLDIGLPLLDGYAVAARLRQRAATRRSLILALTGYGQPQDRRQADAAGFDRLLVKPADPMDLLACIDGWMAPANA